MSKKIKFIFITNIVVTAISVLLLLSVLFINQLSVDCVNTKEDAISIGKIVLKAVYPNYDYEEYYWYCFYNPALEAWGVGCDYEPNSTALGDGLPELYIKKNGKVIRIGLGI